jgi:hypothetical protein
MCEQWMSMWLVCWLCVKPAGQAVAPAILFFSATFPVKASSACRHFCLADKDPKWHFLLGIRDKSLSSG